MRERKRRVHETNRMELEGEKGRKKKRKIEGERKEAYGSLGLRGDGIGNRCLQQLRSFLLQAMHHPTSTRKKTKEDMSGMRMGKQRRRSRRKKKGRKEGRKDGWRRRRRRRRRRRKVRPILSEQPIP